MWPAVEKQLADAKATPGSALDELIRKTRMSVSCAPLSGCEFIGGKHILRLNIRPMIRPGTTQEHYTGYTESNPQFRPPRKPSTKTLRCSA